MIRKSFCLLLGLCLALTLCGCAFHRAAEGNAADEPAAVPAEPEPTATAAHSPEPSEQTAFSEEEETTMLRLLIGDTAVAVTWEDNASVSALCELCLSEPLTIQLSMYGGFEQVGPLGTSLPRSDSQTTTEAGDIVLYAGNQIVIFYGSNAWAYTRLGHITDRSAEDLAALLGQGDVSITLETEGGK